MAVDKAGRYDESELIALNETEAAGGTHPTTISLASALSVALCPTFKCTGVDGGCG
ncbi:hypothetical protein DFR67_10546 [Williamsia limnetica]|jgi:hypothetical protein|uniref:Class II lanthipeptide, LchA2/BrtA2 family n=2 Tax=Mycobacteriales TaxID=85007 RepID=A0ABT4MRU5_GORRU|nr:MULTISPECIES: class II lanthipeptide, LchA2/BrtA2 family [Mycobacteriales]MCZ4549749.1 class II lanthipeptide, LchA2/BrtA2 family [Gordonia rubripertincta]PYE17901.1 hypothetical protein DFR67_10546 [Williamsia limnetica]